jgi:hypothetical protein
MRQDVRSWWKLTCDFRERMFGLTRLASMPALRARSSTASLRTEISEITAIVTGAAMCCRICEELAAAVKAAASKKSAIRRA